MSWLILLSSAMAGEIHCPEPAAPEFQSIDIECVEGSMEVDAVIRSAGALGLVTAQILPKGNYPGYQVDMHLDAEVIGSNERISTYHGVLDPLVGGSEIESFCTDHLEVRFRALDIAGQPGTRVYHSLSPDIANASYENGLDNWGWGGNADVVWGVENAIQSPDGTGMVKIGWPTNADSIGGYIWQPLGAMPHGTYTLQWKDAVATHPGNWPEANCDSALPLFYAGIMRNEGTAFDPVETKSLYGDKMWCGGVPTSTGGYYSRVDWVEREIEFTQNSSQTLDDLYVFFSVTGGYGHQGHLTYLDDLKLTGEFLPQACQRSASLNPALPSSDGTGSFTISPLYTQRPQAITPADEDYYDHGESQGMIALEAACTSNCTSLDGGYGGTAGSRPHGFDGVLQYDDGSVLLAETKSSSRLRSFGQWADTPSATVFEDGNQVHALGLNSAMAGSQSKSSDTNRLMCSDGVKDADGSYRKRHCMQLQGLWNAAVISQICLNESYTSDSGVGAIIEQAWDTGLSCTTWIGYHERVCRDTGGETASWDLVWGSRTTDSGAFTPIATGESCDESDPEHCLLRWYCSSDASGYAQGTQDSSGTTLHETRSYGGAKEDVLATLVLQDPQWAPNKPALDDGFWTYLDEGLGRIEEGQQICTVSAFDSEWETGWDTAW